MNFKKILIITIVSFTLSLSIGCGGGGGGNNDDDDNGNNGDNAASDSDLQSLTTIPQINVDVIDQAAELASGNALVKAQAKGEDPRYFSFEGCGLYSCVSEFKRHFKDFQSDFCVMREIDENTDCDVGDGEYNYCSITFDAEDFGDDEDFQEIEEEAAGDFQESNFSVETRMRCGLLDEDGTNVLRCGVCSNEHNPGSDDFQQNIAITYRVQDGEFIGQITHRFPSFEGEDNDFMRASVAGVEVEELADLANGDRLALHSQTQSRWGSGDITLTLRKEDDAVTDEVDAAFQSDGDWGTWTSRVYGIYNGEEGCSKAVEEGTEPAQFIGDVFYGEELDALVEAGFSTDDQFCWTEPENPSEETTTADYVALSPDGTCSFSYGNEDVANCFWFEYLDGKFRTWVLGNDNAAFYSDVSARDLSDYSAPDISFSDEEAWDCTVPDGANVEEINPDDLGTAFETCFSINDDQDEVDVNSCYDQVYEDTYSEDPVEGCGGNLSYDAAITDENVQALCDCHGVSEDRCCYLKAACSNIDTVSTVGDCADLVFFNYEFGCYGSPGPEDTYSDDTAAQLEDCWGLASAQCNDVVTECEGVGSVIECVDILLGFDYGADFFEDLSYNCDEVNGLAEDAAITEENVDSLCACLLAEGSEDPVCHDVRASCHEEGIETIGQCFDIFVNGEQLENQGFEFDSCDECVAHCMDEGFGDDEECHVLCSEECFVE